MSGRIDALDEKYLEAAGTEPVKLAPPHLQFAIDECRQFKSIIAWEAVQAWSAGQPIDELGRAFFECRNGGPIPASLASLAVTIQAAVLAAARRFGPRVLNHAANGDYWT